MSNPNEHSHQHKHAHTHEHSHDHSHSHGPSADTPKKVLLTALIITSGFMLVEVIGGLISGSLALIADAGHMLTDAGALLLAFAAVTWSAKAANADKSYGYGRLQVLAAFANGIALLALTVWILVEAVGRFNNPQPIESLSMFIVAVIGLLVNLIVFKMLHGSSEDNINIRGAMLHVMGDLLGSVGAILAAILIYWKNWLWADPVLSVLVSLLIVKSAWRLIKESSHILLEGTPPSVDIKAVSKDLKSLQGIVDVHHLHAWCLNEQQLVMTLHAQLESGYSQEAAIAAINSRLHHEFGVAHSTVQIEFGQCPAPDC